MATILFPRKGDRLRAHSVFFQALRVAHAGIGVMSGMVPSRASATSIAVSSGTYRNILATSPYAGGSLTAIPSASTGKHRYDLIVFDMSDSTLKRIAGSEDTPTSVSDFLENLQPIPPELASSQQILLGVIIVDQNGVQSSNHGHYCTAGVANMIIEMPTPHVQGTDQALDYGGENQCLVEDVRVAIDKTSTEAFNCAFNSSFEFVLGAVVLGWAKIGANAAGVQDTGIRDGYGGSKAIKVTSGGSDHEGFKQVLKALKASTTYTVKVWVKATSGDTAKCWTTGGSSNLSITSTSTSGEWKTGTFTTDSTPTDVVLFIGSDTDTDIVWFDCIMVVEGSFAPAQYFKDTEYDKPVQLIFGKGDGSGVVATGQLPDIFHALASWEVLGWEIIESSGSTSNITFDIWKKASFPPANADSIAGTGKPAVSSGTQATGTDLSDWSATSISAGDFLAVELETNSAGKAVALALILRRR